MPVEFHNLPEPEPLTLESEPLALGPLGAGPSSGFGGGSRALRSTIVTATVTFDVDGVATDPAPATATVEVLRADGTILVVAGTSAPRTGTGVFGFTLDAGQTALLDTLEMRWTSALGTIVTYLEIVGGFVFSVAQAKALLPDATTAEIRNARQLAEEELEKALGYALVPRYAYEVISAHHGLLRLRAYARTIRSVSIDGSDLSALQLADLATQGNHLYGYTWPRESLSTPTAVTVGYEHGLDAPPAGANSTALALATTYVGSSTAAVTFGAERLITDDGTLVFGSSGGSFGSFSDPTVNRWVAANCLPVIG